MVWAVCEQKTSGSC